MHPRPGGAAELSDHAAEPGLARRPKGLCSRQRRAVSTALRTAQRSRGRARSAPAAGERARFAGAPDAAPVFAGEPERMDRALHAHRRRTQHIGRLQPSLRSPRSQNTHRLSCDDGEQAHGVALSTIVPAWTAERTWRSSHIRALIPWRVRTAAQGVRPRRKRRTRAQGGAVRVGSAGPRDGELAREPPLRQRRPPSPYVSSLSC
mmetsp:Transcript_23722/g.77128  ORF Transcript_23722/g.77128 Transcript_23722/m.77128 type:complete len:205 (+) Transcript_23722:513-1127(+)